MSGRLLRIANGTLTFRTTLSGQMMVATEAVESIATEEYMQVALVDGTSAPARFVVSDGALQLRRLDGSLTGPIEVTSVAGAAPLPEQPAQGGEAADDGLEAAWDTGVHWRSGNSDYADLFARLSLTHRADEHAFRSRFFLDRADADRFPRWFRADTEWSLAPDDPLYPVAALEVERDTEAAMSLRGSLSLGIGKSLFASATDQLEGDLGVGGTTEYFDAALPEKRLSRALWRGRDTREDQALHARLRLRYARALFQNGTFEEDFRFYPSLTEFGELRARSESSLLFPFTPWLKLKLDLLVDYESEPEFELDHWRTSVGASLRWDF